ncbi:hypothetical protein Patl1_35379 [Pistacia atlantica]|nr:hypothetical protein Patl1_35379 [Pistacia atlantica]
MTGKTGGGPVVGNFGVMGSLTVLTITVWGYYQRVFSANDKFFSGLPVAVGLLTHGF